MNWICPNTENWGIQSGEIHDHNNWRPLEEQLFKWSREEETIKIIQWHGKINDQGKSKEAWETVANRIGVAEKELYKSHSQKEEKGGIVPS